MSAAPDRPRTGAPRPDAPRRPAVRSGRIVLGVLLVLVGAGWLVDATGLADVRWSAFLPALLLVIGVTLLATARRPSTGGLVAAGIVVSVLVVVPSLVTIPLSGRTAVVGDVRERPPSAEEAADGFGLAMGSLEVDLRELRRAGNVTVEAGVGVGELVVLLPSEATVVVHGRAGVGEVVVDGNARSGADVDVRERLEGAEAGAVLSLEASVGMGKVEVRR